MSTKRQNVPALRFSEFKEDWCKSTIEQNFEFKNGLNKEKQFFGRGTPIINFKDVFHLRAIRSSDINGLVELSDKEIINFSVKKGDVFFTRTSETIEDIGISATLVEDVDNCVFSGFVLRARPINNNLDDIYKSYCFSTEPVRREIVTKSSYTTRALTSGRLLNKVNFYYPSDLLEQQKIADFLSSVDTRIEQLEKKKSLLEQYKKGLMQKLFSQEIRFKDDQGEEYPEWQDKIISEIVTVKKGNMVSQNDVVTKGYPVIAGGKSSPYRYTSFNYENVITVSASGAFAGYVSFHSYRIWASDCTVIRAINYQSTLFIYFLMKFQQEKIFSLQSGGAQPHVYPKDIQVLRVKIPCSSEEQNKIADFLSSIDRKIELITEQINQTQKFKKGLLQQMFV